MIHFFLGKIDNVGAGCLWDSIPAGAGPTGAEGVR
jgi:hypothetical protein